MAKKKSGNGGVRGEIAAVAKEVDQMKVLLSAIFLWIQQFQTSNGIPDQALSDTAPGDLPAVPAMQSPSHADMVSRSKAPAKRPPIGDFAAAQRPTVDQTKAAQRQARRPAPKAKGAKSNAD